ncbi:hypothetical protein GCM10010967_03430 [Dyadobacter beijingensis]|uniref:Two component regulator propeller n=1 Tax=Dyadobacter beijingensis TaxID=365489 RepID=A0ABQ2HCV8_9BACT|nr:hypothetical protein [Dyadobacter beijingensis]GGM75178.1 hypothetical protein GCM10010967_03430 [Dyadobacter beijingensis]
MRAFEKLLIYWLVCGLLPALVSCRNGKAQEEEAPFYQDQPFTQEYHEAYPIDGAGEVRAVLPEANGNVWAAAANGVFLKLNRESKWNAVLPDSANGPAFALAQDASGTMYMGVWNGLYQYKNGVATKMNGPTGPVSAICTDARNVHAIGPNGFWTGNAKGFIKQNAAIARSVRDVVSDGKNGLWIASDVGIYHWTPESLEHFYQTGALIAGYAKGLAFNHDGKLWIGGLGGVTIQNNGKKEAELRPENGIPSTYVTAVRRAPDSSMWVGTQTGVVRFRKDGSRSLLFSRRWLLDDQVNDIAFDSEGNAWIATPQGVSAIRKRNMTLASKSAFFYDVLMKRHIREPWIAGQAHLRVPGDTASWEPEDDDNDGEYTGNYLAMESFRYAAIKDPVAKDNARKAFGFLKMLQEVTGTDGFFARTIIPATWTRMHDDNSTYTERERAEELAKEPRFKPVEVRWHLSPDKKWLWKGDTSSDEMCGHMFGYYYYYTLAADAAEKQRIAGHVGKIVDYLMAHGLNFADVDGTATRWSVWSPDQLNRDPEWLPDRAQNSMEMLAFLKLAHYMTGQEKYQKEYLRLIEKEHYLENMQAVTKQNPAWFIYFDVVLQAYLYPILIRCEKDPERSKFYKNHLEEWFRKRQDDHNPLINFIYNDCLDQKAELKNSVDFLIDTPLDLVDWPIDHRKREDIRVVRTPVLEDEQVSELQPASIRLTVRWDKNPWTLAGGNPEVEREPVFWLLPYWMGRYLGMISK